MAYLRHWFNGQTISVFQLGDSAIVGRHPECAIQVDDATVSGQHARLVRGAEGYTVEDLDSTNGVSIDGKKVAQYLLHNGAIFTLGTQEFEFLDRLPDDLDKTLKIKKSWIPGVYFAQ